VTASPAPASRDAGPTTSSVAIVHDYLNQRGGAERVALEMAEMWPDAPIYTSLYRPESTFEGFKDYDIRTSWLQGLPVDKHFRALLPLYPSAFASLGELDHDVVLSSSSGWAHAIRTAPDSTHVVYCHAPARWLYSGDQYFHEQTGRQKVLGVSMKPLRRWDRRAAHRPDRYVANSHNVADRIRDAYGIEADVVHPPVNVERFTPRPRRFPAPGRARRGAAWGDVWGGDRCPRGEARRPRGRGA